MPNYQNFSNQHIFTKMGIFNMFSLISQTIKYRNIKTDFKGQTCAIDMYTWLHKEIYKEASSFGSIQGNKYIQNILQSLEKLLSYEISKIICVFDGNYHFLKKQIEENRQQQRKLSKQQAEILYKQRRIQEANKKFAASINVNTYLARDLIRNIQKIEKISIIVAPYEADAQLAYLSINNFVDFIISEDSDILVFGAKKIIFKLNLYTGECQQASLENIFSLQQYELNNSLIWNQDKFILACILSGCDYIPKNVIKNNGIQKILELFQKKYSLFEIVLKLFQKRKIANIYTTDQIYEQILYAFLAFKYQRVFCPKKQKLVLLTDIVSEVKNDNGDKQIVLIDNEVKSQFQYQLDLPHELNLVYQRLINKNQNQKFLDICFGEDYPQDLAQKVAKGELNPITKKMFIDEEYKELKQRKFKQKKSEKITTIKQQNNQKKIEDFILISKKIKIQNNF